MLRQVATNTNVIIYLMAVVGVLGVLAKLINHLTLRRLVKAAGNMPKSTHGLVKLVRAKYEHACMIHDSVENIDVFVEKYIYEYRGFLFRIHTWRQIETLSVWFAGILAAIGAWLEYSYFGVTETVYQYIAAGIAEVVLLSVVMRLSDEPYKINAVKMYMADYLENICAFRLRKQSQREREFIDVIAAENGGKNAAQPAAGSRRTDQENETSKGRGGKSVLSLKRRQGDESGKTTPRQDPDMLDTAGAAAAFHEQTRAGDESAYTLGVRTAENTAPGSTVPKAFAGETSGEAGVRPSVDSASGGMGEKASEGLSINIEGEPRAARQGDAARQAVRSAASGNVTDEERTALKEEAIRQILEEFLA